MVTSFESGGLVLVMPDGLRVPVNPPLTIGRGEQANVHIDDETVSRMHARITLGPDGPLIEDAGSRYGTLLSGARVTAPTPLHHGSVIRLGDISIGCENGAPEAIHDSRGTAPSGEATFVRRLDPGPGETIVVPVNATLMGLRPATGPAAGVDGGLRPRVRSGWALKRLGAEEGEERFVLRDLRGGAFLRMEAADAALLELLDGRRSVTELLGDAERIVGPAGPGRLARLVADLADHGLLDGVSATPVATVAPSRLERIFKPRERSVEWVGRYFERAYQGWGRVLFSPLVVTFLVLSAVAGFGAFWYLVGHSFGTPFLVARHLVLGGAVFMLGRFALVAMHEIAHGLALAHYGRRAPRAGLRLVLIFPYAFVDTSEGYFESRAHRIVISAAGPVCDLTIGALFSFACVVSSGAVRDVFFQLAFGAYLGAFFNLNPFLDRDGYNILVDYLREPRLRQRARQQFTQKLSGETDGGRTSVVLGRYALGGVIWSALGAAFAIVVWNSYSNRWKRTPELSHAPPGLVLTVFIVVSVLLFAPVLAQLGLPLLRRVRFGPRDVNRVIR